MLKCLNIRDITGTEAIDAVTFDFKGTRVRCFVSGSTGYQMSFSSVQNVSKWLQLVIWKFEWNAFIHLELADINVKRT